MTAALGPSDLLATAQIVLEQSPRSMRVDGSAAAVLLVRQALEMAIDDFWRARTPEMADVTDRAQQISLPFYIGSDLGVDVGWAWSRLSHLCHHTAYEMAPTASEVEDLIAIVERVADRSRSAESD